MRARTRVRTRPLSLANCVPPPPMGTEPGCDLQERTTKGGTQRVRTPLVSGLLESYSEA